MRRLHLPPRYSVVRTGCFEQLVDGGRCMLDLQLIACAADRLGNELFLRRCK